MKYFETRDTAWGSRNGQRITVLGPTPEKDFDRAEVGPMFRCKFDDGVKLDVFEDELQETTQ